MAFRKSEKKQVQARALRIVEEIGTILARHFPEVADDYRNGNTLPELAGKYVRCYEEYPRIAIESVRYALQICIPIMELRKIGRQHMQESALERSLKGVSARGHVSYESEKRIRIGDKKFDEMQYVNYLKNNGCEWKEIVKLANMHFHGNRTIKGLSAKYCRWRRE